MVKKMVENQLENFDENIMIIEGKSYSVTIKDIYIDDDSDRLVVKGDIHNKINNEDHKFDEYIVLDGYQKIDENDEKSDIYDN